MIGRDIAYDCCSTLSDNDTTELKVGFRFLFGLADLIGAPSLTARSCESFSYFPILMNADIKKNIEEQIS